MNTPILRTAAPAIAILMAILSIVVLLRGHNAPGGGFIGGLIAASAVAIWGMAFGVGAVRRLLRLNPIVCAAVGLMITAASGVLSLGTSAPYLTGIWLPGYFLGTPALFDVGVYLVVAGTLAAIALALEDSGEGE